MLPLIDYGINTLFLYLIILNFFLSVFIIARNPKSSQNRSFSLLCFALSVWMLSLFAGKNLQSGEIWSKLAFFNQIVIIVDVFYLSFIYPRKEKQLTSAALIFGTAYFVIFSFLLFFTEFWLTGKTLGNAYLLFITISWIPIAWTIINFYQKIQSSMGLEKQQTAYIFYAYLFWAFNANFLASLFILSSNIIAYLSFSALASLVLAIAIFYAIARYRLLDIRFLVAKSITYGILAFIVIAFYSFSIYLFSLYIYSITITEVSLLMNISTTLLIVLTVFPLKKYLEKITSKTILKDKLYQNESLLKFGKIFNPETSLSDLANDFCIQLREIMLLENVNIIFKGDNGLNYSNSFLSLNIINQLEHQNKNFLIFDEMTECELKQKMQTAKIYAALKNQTKENKDKIKYKCFILLGYKLSGNIYFEDERHFLQILSEQFFNVLDRVILHSQLMEFNQRLESRVKTATEKLEEKNHKLRKTVSIKDELISIVSHELTVPMVAISGSLLTIVEGFAGKIPDKAKDFLISIYNENTRLIRLTKNLLSISKIRTGRLDYVIENFNPNVLLEDIAELAGSLVKEKNLKLIVDFPKNVIKVKADKDKLKEVIINLLDNAIKYTKKGAITIGCKQDKERVHFFVQDTGLGISEDARLFNSAVLAENQEKELDHKKQGLGLYICYRLLMGMKGEISYQSKTGKGTVFNFYLPKGK